MTSHWSLELNIFIFVAILILELLCVNDLFDNLELL